MNQHSQLKHVEKALEELALILRKTELVASGNIDHPVVTEMAYYLTQIRLQLSELVKATAGRTDEQGEAIKKMADQCCDLEGRMKEIRNDKTPSGDRDAGQSRVRKLS